MNVLIQITTFLLHLGEVSFKKNERFIHLGRGDGNFECVDIKCDLHTIYGPNDRRAE